MRYIKTYETFRLNPLSDEEIKLVFEEIQNKLTPLGLHIELKKQEYGRQDIDDPKYRNIFEIDSDISKIKNSIIDILIHRIVKEPFTYAGVPYGTDIEITILNEFPCEHANHLMSENKLYINPQTPEELYESIINKIISDYNERTDKLTVLVNRLSNSNVKDVYPTSQQYSYSIKHIIIECLTSVLNNKPIPEYIFKEIAESIEYTHSPYNTVHFLNNNELFKFIYKGIEKYLKKDLKKASMMGEMGFGD